MYRLQQLALLVVVGLAGYGAWTYYSKSAAKTSDQLLTDFKSGGAVDAELAHQELGSRASSGKLDPPTFVGWTRDTDDRVKVLGLELIGRKATKEGKAAALHCFADKSVKVRLAAVEVFKSCKSKDAIESLLAMLQDADADVAQGARGALENITDQRFKETGKWREWWDINKKTFQVPE